jgi:hypothetical protein
MWSITLNGKLHLAPIGPTPENVLDIGTGTGIWAIEFGIIYKYVFPWRVADLWQPMRIHLPKSSAPISRRFNLHSTVAPSFDASANLRSAFLQIFNSRLTMRKTNGFSR